MKLETAIIIAKGLVVLVTASASALVGSLAQWSNESSGPSDIQWIIIIGTTISAGGSALGGFLSSSFGKYLQNRNGKTDPPTVP